MRIVDWLSVSSVWPACRCRRGLTIADTGSDVNKDMGPKAKDLGLKAKAKDLRCQSQ